MLPSVADLGDQCDMLRVLQNAAAALPPRMHELQQATLTLHLQWGLFFKTVMINTYFEMLVNKLHIIFDLLYMLMGTFYIQ